MRFALWVFCLISAYPLSSFAQNRKTVIEEAKQCLFGGDDNCAPGEYDYVELTDRRALLYDGSGRPFSPVRHLSQGNLVRIGPLRELPGGKRYFPIEKSDGNICDDQTCFLPEDQEGLTPLSRARLQTLLASCGDVAFKPPEMDPAPKCRQQPPPTVSPTKTPKKSYPNEQAFMRCYLPPSTFDAYQKNQGLGEKAGRTFSLPPSALNCMVARESRFDPYRPNGDSNGPAQFDKAAFDDVKKLLTQKNPSESVRKLQLLWREFAPGIDPRKLKYEQLFGKHGKRQPTWNVVYGFAAIYLRMSMDAISGADQQHRNQIRDLMAAAPAATRGRLANQTLLAMVGYNAGPSNIPFMAPSPQVMQNDDWIFQLNPPKYFKPFPNESPDAFRARRDSKQQKTINHLHWIDSCMKHQSVSFERPRPGCSE